MKCAVIRRYGEELSNLVLTEREEPGASGENVRVRVTATALNRADLLQRRGLYDPPPGVVKDIPGLEFVGTVDRTGDAVTEWKGGERVFGLVPGGAYAEYVVSHQRTLVRVPDNMRDVEAAAVPEAFITAHDAVVTQGGVKPGDLVLVHGVAGGVGSAAVQIVRLWGASAVGTAGSRNKLNRVQEFAPFYPVNYREVDFREYIERRYGECPVDIVLDVIGGEYWERNLALLKPRGTLILVGLMGGSSAATPLAAILTKRLRVIGTVLRSRPIEEKIAVTKAFARQVLPHFGSGRLRPVVDSVFPFEQIHQATGRMEKRENIGKIILTMQA